MRLDLSLLFLALPLAVLGSSRHNQRRVHQHGEIAKRTNATVELQERGGDARWTFYDVGGAPGACGKYNSPGEFIVALNSAQYGGGYPGPQCWKKIIMEYNGKRATATITDECPGCPYRGLDLTRGLFSHFAALDEGVIYGNWWFADEAPEEPEPKPEPKPTTQKPKPTTTSKPPPPPPTTTHHTTTHHTTTTTTSKEKPTTTSTKKSSTSVSSTHATTKSSVSILPTSASASASVAASINTSSGVASGSAVPTASLSTERSAQNLLACNQALVYMGGLIAAGAEAD